MRKLVLIVPFLLFFSTAEAAFLDLAWSPNEESDVAGYRVYYGTSSGDYINSVNVGNETGYRLDDLIDDVIYYISLTAYDLAGNESDFSEEVYGVGIASEEADSSVESSGQGGGNSGCFVSAVFR